MITLQEAIAEAEQKKVAIGHFNVPNLEIFWAVVHAAKKLDQPVIIGISEGERDFVGIQQMGVLVASVRATGMPVYLNADHSYSFERVKQAADFGVFDSIIFDGAALSYPKNSTTAKQCADYVHTYAPHVLLEGELGFIGSGSDIKEVPPEGVAITEEHMTKPEEAAKFVRETGVDLLAPAVGNLHGILKGGENPHINPERVTAIRKAAGVPLVLHGGSGISNDDFKKGIAAGLAVIHVSTELRIAYREALEQALKDQPDQLAPYKLMQPVVEAVQKVVEEKIKLFSAM